jgi:integrase
MRNYKKWTRVVWNGAMDALKLKYTPHAARHTFATQLLYKTNGNLAVVADMLGDTLDVTARTYAHVIKDLRPHLPGVMDQAYALPA